MLLLDSGQQFSVNATNWKTLITLYGEHDTDWKGKPIELFAGFTTFQNSEKESVLIRPISSSKPLALVPPIERTAPNSERPNDMDDETEIPF